MLKRLIIKNYALIEHIDIHLDEGFTVITGETGAGKSILLGALGLILGNRADHKLFNEQSKKCIIEGYFKLDKSNVDSFFQLHDFDFEEITILRREISSSGKSRLFLNDTPISLEQIKQFSTLIIDIHSQHQSLLLNDNLFKFQLIDVIAENDHILREYREQLKMYQFKTTELEEIREKLAQYEKERDFVTFQLNEIKELNLKQGEEEELNKELTLLSNAEELIQAFRETDQLMNQEEFGLTDKIHQLNRVLERLSNMDEEFLPLSQKSNNVLFEIQDLALELGNYSESIEQNPQRLEFVEERLGQIHRLNTKHRIVEPDGLLNLEKELIEQDSEFDHSTEKVDQLEKEINQLKEKLNALAKKLHENRKRACPVISSYVKEKLRALAMPKAEFKIVLEDNGSFTKWGKENIQFLFSANQGTKLNEVSKTASGGEISRLMLSLKSLQAKHQQLPCIIFDEIDSGISGEIANKMGDLLLEMSKSRQVISITHLPQVASKGRHHFLVSKTEMSGQTRTHIQGLNSDERIVEVAKMLSGNSLSDAAIINAKELINNN